MQRNLVFIKLHVKRLAALSLAFILTLSSLISPVYSKQAKINSKDYISVEKIYEAQVDKVTLLINELDLETDSETTNTKQVRFLLDASSLMTKTYPQAIKVKAYTKDENNKESIISIINSTIFKQAQASSYSFILNIPASFNSSEVLLDVYDADTKLQASFKQYIEKTSSEESQILQAADCSKEEFGDCQLQYILNAINYQASPSKNRHSVITKETSGNYTVSLPLVKSKGINFVNNIGQGPVTDGEGSLGGLSATQVISLVSQGNFSFEQLQLKTKELSTENLPADGTIEFDGEKLYLVRNGERKELGRQGEPGPPGAVGSFSGANPVFSNTATMNGIFKLTAQSTPPSSPVAGDIYHDISGAVCVYMNGNWGKLYGTGTCPGAIDTSPDAFNFVDSVNRASQITYSDSVIIQNFANAVISISGQGNPEYRVNSGAYTNSPTSVNHGDIVRLRLTSNGTLGQSHTANISIGTQSDTWTVTTSTCPENFAFIPGSAGRDSLGKIDAQYLNGWCVSQYEMTPQGTSLWTRDGANGWHYQNSSGAGKSITAKGNGGDSFPITQITRNEAAAACASDLTLKDGTPLANGKLLTVYFWSNINQAIVDDGINWSGGTPGSGNLSRGNGSAGGPLAGITEGTTATQPTTGVFYYGGSTGRAWRMGNGQDSIYDIAGNVWEWFDDLHNNAGGAVLDDIDGSTLAYMYDNPNGSADITVLPSEKSTHDNTASGVGRIFVNSAPLISGATYAAIYSGTWSITVDSGVFTSYWSNYLPSTTRSLSFGFRCIIPSQ